MSAGAGTRRWGLQRWGLRPKVAVVVAFPLVVALALGSLRLGGEVHDAVDLADAAKSVDGLHAVVETEAVVGAVAGRAMAGTLLASDLDPLNAALADLNRVRLEPNIPPAAAAAMRDMATVAAELRAPGPLSEATVAALIQIEHSVAADSDAIVEAVLQPMNSAELIEDKNTLLDLWAAQRQLFAVAVGLVRVIRNPGDPGLEIYGADGGYAVLLDRVSRHYPADDPTIKELRDALRDEAPLLGKVRAAIPEGGMAIRTVGYGNALVKDQGTYGRLVGALANKIAATVDAKVDQSRAAAVRDSLMLLATLVIGLAIAMLVARALLRPLRVLHDSARRVAQTDLPAEVARIEAGADAAEVLAFAPVPVDSDEEIGQVARAVDDIHGQALRLAEQQRRLRSMVNDIFDALARRTKSLLDRQLALIGALEEHEQDPQRLDSLFQLDHLATRMRRNGDNLLVLAGTQAVTKRLEPMPIVEVLQASISEVEEYQRVRMEAMPDLAIRAAAAVDVVHLLSELLDNALRASADREVHTRCLAAPDGGTLLEIVDQGIGIGSSDLAMLNARLSSSPEVSPETARRMGLFVVGRLAERHGIAVRLQRSAARLDDVQAPTTDGERPAGARLRPTFDPFGTGVTATVHIPVELIVADVDAEQAAILAGLEADWLA